MSDDGYKVISVSATTVLTEARLYDSVVRHINEEHPEVATTGDVVAVVSEAVSNPAQIHASTTHSDNSLVFIGTLPTNPGQEVRVPVRIIEGTSGRVTAAYISSSGTYQGALVWSRADET